jgi:hypothetical protein
MNDSSYILGPSSSPDTAAFTEALGKAQIEYPVIELDSVNPHFKSKFASFETCCLALRGPLTKNGFALPDYRSGLVGGQWVVIGTLRHKTGQWISSMAPLLMPKGDMQGYASAMKYAKRSLLLALASGFSGEVDDDGESLREDAVPQRAPQQPTKAIQQLQLEQGWKKSIADAAERAAAVNVMKTVELRLREKAIDRACYDRCKAEFTKCWETKEVVSNG